MEMFRQLGSRLVSGLDISALVEHEAVQCVFAFVNLDEFGFYVPLKTFGRLPPREITEKLVLVLGVERLNQEGNFFRSKEAEARGFRPVFCGVPPVHVRVFKRPRNFHLARRQNVDHIFREHLSPSGNLDAFLAASHVVGLKVRQCGFTSNVDAAIRLDSYNLQLVSHYSLCDPLSQFVCNVAFRGAKKAITFSTGGC